MRKHILFTIFFIVSASFARAGHPEVKNIVLDGQDYSCRPAIPISYCPPLTADIFQGIMDDMARHNCLNSLNPSSATTSEIRECYLTSSLKALFNDWQLLGLSQSCLLKKADECSAYHNKCSDPPCGSLGEFIKVLSKQRFAVTFTESDGRAACQSLVY